MKPPTLMCSTSAGESTGTRAERYTVGTIEVGRREMIKQNESFPTASDHIPHAGKMVVGGDGEVKLRHSTSSMPRWLACGGRGHGMGLWLTNLVVQGGVEMQTRHAD